MLRRIDSQLSELADADQLAQAWPVVEKAVEGTMQVKQIDKAIHEQ